MSGAPRRTEHATCLGCGCACDDITVVTQESSIADAENACTLGRAWFGDGAVPAVIRSGGRAVQAKDALTDAAKLFAAPVGKEVADNAMQVLGGWGYCTEYKVERFFRDAKLLEIGGGTLESHQKNITRELIGRIT